MNPASRNQSAIALTNNRPNRDKGDIVPQKLFVGNLDFETTEAELREEFERYGVVERVKIITDRETGRSRGFAFVDMTTTAEGDAAIYGLNGNMVGRREISVVEAKPRPEGQRTGRRERQEQGSKKIVLDNLFRC